MGSAFEAAVASRETLEQRKRDEAVTAAMRAAHGRLCQRCSRCGRCRPRKMRTPDAGELDAICSPYGRTAAIRHPEAATA